MRHVGWIVMAIGVACLALCALPFVLWPVVALRYRFFPPAGTADHLHTRVEVSPGFLIVLTIGVTLTIVGWAMRRPFA